MQYEDAADMKLDFPYESEISQLTEEKGNKAIGLSRAMHIPQNVQSTISPSTAELDLKIASVKKVILQFASNNNLSQYKMNLALLYVCLWN